MAQAAAGDASGQGFSLVPTGSGLLQIEFTPASRRSRPFRMRSCVMSRRPFVIIAAQVPGPAGVPFASWDYESPLMLSADTSQRSPCFTQVTRCFPTLVWVVPSSPRKVTRYRPISYAMSPARATTITVGSNVAE